VQKEILAERVFASLRSDFDLAQVLDVLNISCSGEFYVFGGSIRDVALGRSRGGDLDIMVPNGDRRAFEELDRLAVPYRFNSQQHRRYFWNRLQIDIFEPKDFFIGFPDVEQAVAYFDLRMNALALHVGSGRIIDPLDGLRYIENRNPGIHWKRWIDAKPEHLLVLLIRLARLLYDNPELALPSDDAERVRGEFLSRVENLDWEPVQNRFPLGKKRFMEVCNEMLERRNHG